MMLSQHITALQPSPTPGDVCSWAQELTDLHKRLAPHFARAEPRRRALLYLQGLLSETERKNSWHLAEHAREKTPYGMQRLLSGAVWDADGVRDEVRAYVLEHLGRESAILVIDETSFPKRGEHSAGVAIQYCGTTGQVENCQVGVFLSLVLAKGHTLIDRELYLPADWCEDQQRCQAAGIPETLRFRTKPELARAMIERIREARVPISWVVADTVYGGNLDLRTWLQEQGYPYVLAVPCHEPVGLHTSQGRQRVQVSQVEARLLAPEDWQRLSMGEGTKGPRIFDWALVPILHRWQDDGRNFLLLRRSLSDPSDKRYFFVFAPLQTSLQQMVLVCGARWRIEEDFEMAKDTGLDHYQVRDFTAWYRHVTLVLVALAYLAGMCAMTSGSMAPATSSESGRNPVVLPLTVPEVRHLLGRLIWPAPSNTKGVLAWSWWRRCHHRCASYYHAKRRRETG